MTDEINRMTPEERLENALQEQIKLIEQEIDNINNRQIEIQSVISDLTNEISDLNETLRNIQDPAIKYKFYSILNTKMELMSTYYSIYSSFEDTKFRYIQNRGDSNLKFLRQLHIELVKVSKEIDDTSLSASELLTQLNFIAKLTLGNQNKEKNSDETDFEIPENIRKELTYSDECKL